MARIFVIDDDDQLLRMVGLMLERGGHNITLINNPHNGLEQLKTHKPDLLVLDVMMPGMSGHDLTRQIRETSELESLPILILTARSQDIDRDTALKSGADGYLSKPVTSQELIEQVDKLLTKEPAKSKQAGSVQGMVLTFFGLRGGVGKTTLATNLALALRRISRQEVCLVDLSLSGSQTASHLQLKPQSNWADLSTPTEIDWTILQERLMIHSSGLRLLAAPALPQTPAALSADFIQRAITLLRKHMIFTVVDLPPVFHPAFTALLDMSDVGLHVITPDVVSVRTAVQTNRALDIANVRIKQKSFVLNHVSPNAQLSQATVERAVSGRIPFHVGYDTNQERALPQGKPLALGTSISPLPTVVKRMADVIWKRMSAKMKS